MTNTSLPQKLSDDAKAMLAQADLPPQQIAALLKKEWADNGFDMIKNKHFEVDDKTFMDEMSGLFDDAPDMNTMAGPYMDSFKKSYLKLKYDDKHMTGKNIMSLRNQYAKAANRSSADPSQASVFRTIAKKVDELMTENIPNIDKNKFKSELAAYDSQANLMKSTGKAKQDAGKFTPKGWLAGTTNARAATGTGPQQNVADAALEAQAAVKRGVDEQITALPTKAQNDASKLAGEADVLAARQGRSDLQERLPANSNLWNKLLSTKMITPSTINTAILGAAGGAAGGAIGAPLAMLSGAGIARGLATNPVQRLIAGQSVDELLDLGRKARVGSSKPRYNKLGKLVKNDGLSLADILRQGTAAGTVQGQIE